MQQNTLYIVVVIVVIAAAGAWFYFYDGKLPARNGAAKQSEAVARVEGKEITRAELDEVVLQTARGQGVTDIDSLEAEQRTALEAQVLDQLIARTLVELAVADSGIVASEADVEAELEAVRAQFPDNNAYQQALVDQGFTEATLREQIEQELAANAYFEQELNFASIEVTEAEVQEEYDLAAAQDEELPPLEEVRDEIETFILQQKRQQQIAAHVAELRESAEIEILI